EFGCPVEIGRDVTRCPVGELVEHADGGTDLAGGAVAALEGVVLDELCLERMHLPVAESGGGDDLGAVVRGGEGQAREDAPAADQHGARSALTEIASLLRGRDPEAVAQCVEHGGADVDRDATLHPVDVENYVEIGSVAGIGPRIPACHGQTSEQWAVFGAFPLQASSNRRDATSGASAARPDPADTRGAGDLAGLRHRGAGRSAGRSRCRRY